MPLHHERLLTRYAAWSNTVIYDALAPLPDDELVRARETTFGTLLRTLGHNYAVGAIFRAHLERCAHGFTSRLMPDTTTFDALRALQHELDAWYVAYADDLSAALAAEPLRFDYVGGGAGVMTRAQMVLHVVNHGTYHRGFLVDAMRYRDGSRIAVPATDLTVFLRDGAMT